MARARKTNKLEQGSRGITKPTPCPKCKHPMVSRIKHEYVINECMNCGKVARIEIAHD